MVQELSSQPSIFGRLGKGLAQGLSETVPKEVERYRLAEGLKAINEQKNFSPFERFSGLLTLPGMTPQGLQTAGELLRQEQRGNAYKNAGGGNPKFDQGIRDVQFANSQSQQGQPQKIGQSGQNMSPSGAVANQQRTPNIKSTEDVPQVLEGNVLNQQNLARLPWTPEQRNRTVSNYIDQGFLPEEAKELQVNDEARDLAEPGVHKQRLKDIEEGNEKIRDALSRHLETKLQKNKENIFEDIEGPMLLNAERGMKRDLILNPKADIDNIANDWSERLYRTALAKGKMKTLGQTTGIENFFKGDTAEKKLKEYQDIFKKSGNLEEFKNILQGPDFGMSAQGSASIAYPPNMKINKFLTNYRSSSGTNYHSSNKDQEARKAALDIEKDIGPDDSVLSIVRKLSEKDPYFDQQSFLDQISEDKDQIGLNPRQRLELAEGVKNILPHWADILYLQIFRR